MKVMFGLLKDWPCDKFQEFIEYMAIFCKENMYKSDWCKLKTNVYNFRFWDCGEVKINKIALLAWQILGKTST